MKLISRVKLKCVKWAIPLFLLLFCMSAIVPARALCDGLDTWTDRTSGTTPALYVVAYGKGTFVAVGFDSEAWQEIILTSPDGVTWKTRYSGVTSSPRKVTYGKGTFVAVGETAVFNRGLILTSPKGATWKERDSGATYALNGVTYGNGTFVVVGRHGLVFTSPDGVTWRKRTSGTDHSLSGVTYGKGTFVAVGYSGTILASPDGVTWMERTSGTIDGLLEVTYGNSTFVAVGEYGNILQSDTITTPVANPSPTPKPSPVAQKGSIYGSVTDYDDGILIESVRLKLRGVGIKVNKTTLTDSEGSYEINDLDAGTYQIKATNAFYKTITKTVELEGGENRVIEFEMKPRK